MTVLGVESRGQKNLEKGITKRAEETNTDIAPEKELGAGKPDRREKGGTRLARACSKFFIKAREVGTWTRKATSGERCAARSLCFKFHTYYGVAVCYGGAKGGTICLTE